MGRRKDKGGEKNVKEKWRQEERIGEVNISGNREGEKKMGVCICFVCLSVCMWWMGNWC